MTPGILVGFVLLRCISFKRQVSETFILRLMFSFYISGPSINVKADYMLDRRSSNPSVKIAAKTLIEVCITWLCILGQ